MNKRVVTIDNGGSELRLISNTNDDSKVITMDKNISLVDYDSFRVKENVEEFDIIKIEESTHKSYLGTYATGYGYYMYGGVDLSITGKKSESLAWYQQVLCAISIDAIKAARDKEVDAGVTIEPYDYVVTTLIPVQEHSGSVDCVSNLKEKLSGTYTVSFPVIKSGIDKVTFSINKQHIGVLPEGVVALASLDGLVTNNDYTLIIDMGHVTTDLTICKGYNMLGSFVVSSPFAGGTILNLIGSIVRGYGVVCSESMAIESLRTNMLSIGKREIKIEKELDHMKKVFVSNYIKKEIMNQIELVGITTSNIKYVVPIGAILGSKNPKDGSMDILNMIIEETKLENAEIKLLAKDLRYVNINEAAAFCNQFAEGV